MPELSRAKGIGLNDQFGLWTLRAANKKEMDDATSNKNCAPINDSENTEATL